MLGSNRSGKPRMDQTANLSLPYIMPSQAQKNVTHNEALKSLDTLVQLAVLDRDLSAPPGTPAEGDRYLVKATATGGWTGHDGAVATFVDGAWTFFAAHTGWQIYVADEQIVIAWTGSAWLAVGQSLNRVPMLGVLATADTTNRLAVKSDAVLFANDDVTPGSGDIRATLSKAAAGRTASFLFQDDFSGRAEFGLTGDDDFHLKVSADGSSWADALVVGAAHARVGVGGNFGRGVPLTVTADHTLGDAENWLVNNKTGSALVLTLPAASSFPGREIMLKTVQAQAGNSASANVVPLAGGSVGTAILAGTAGKWAALVSDGTNWVVTQAN